jgi:agmatine/peptidylarginine deiminase
MPVTLPAEWAPQSGVLLTWPHAESDWRDALDEVEPVFLAIAHAVTRFEHLLVASLNDGHRAHIADRLLHADVDITRVTLIVTPSNDTWARDHGPITVIENGRPVLLDFRFNGWGGKHEWGLDDQITRCLHEAGAFGAIERRGVELILEGGSIESDGAGTLLTTASCLLTPTRNPQYDRAGVEAELRRLLGVQRVLWLEHGHLEGDDTDSHVDTLARLCDANTIAYQCCDDPQDSHYPALAAMEGELQAFRTAAGEPYRLMPLPWPRPQRDADGRRLPATYANFLIINGAVLAPVYDDPADAIALSRLRECFPGREIIAVDCRALIRQNGSLHCVTMQLPEGVLPQ